MIQPKAKKPRSVAQHLFTEPFAFDFFQAMRVLERLAPTRRSVGHGGSPDAEVVRLRAHPSLDFPASAIQDLVPAGKPLPGGPVLSMPAMVVNFFGLAGPSGVLPRHYTEMLLRLQMYAKGPERTALRDWLDLFNHRLLSLFYRAWKKYRFYIAYELAEFERRESDAFTRCLFSLIGLGTTPLRDRLRVAARTEGQLPALADTFGEGRAERALARVDDLALLRYSGFLAHRPRCAVSLEALLRGYLKLPLRVQQFEGQWLRLEPEAQPSVGGRAAGSMGVNVVVGERVWDVQSRIRIRIGPLSYGQFQEFLPDRSLVPQRKLVFLLAQLVRLYVGLEIDVDVQLVLRADEVPACRMGRGVGGLGSRLGWNTWSRSRAMRRDADDAVFQVDEGVWLHVPAGAL